MNNLFIFFMEKIRFVDLDICECHFRDFLRVSQISLCPNVTVWVSTKIVTFVIFNSIRFFL